MNRAYEHYQQAQSLTVRLMQWHGDEESGEWEETGQMIKEKSSLDPTFLTNLQNYIANGSVLLDIEETDLKNVTGRVAEQMVLDGIVEKLDVKNVSNALLFTQLTNSEDEFEERKSDRISFKDTATVDIQALIATQNVTLNLQSGSLNIFSETALVMVGNFDFIQKPTVAFVRLMTAVCFPETKDCDDPVRFLVILLGPIKESHDYTEVARCICSVLRDEDFRIEAYNAKTKGELIKAIKKVSANRQVVPPVGEIVKNKEKKRGEEHARLITNENRDTNDSINPLLKTNRLWGGLINDITRRIPQYKSDIYDGLNRETIAASIFLYFGVLSTAITFGGLMSSKTHNLMGISETLLATSMTGIIFHLISAQPLMIIGGTGPLLLFDEALFQMCGVYNLDFLTVRIYIGLWLGLIAVVIAAFDGCVYLRLLTRFTQELFASLISLIFMMEAIFKIIEVFKVNPILIEMDNDNMTSMGEFIVDQAANNDTGETSTDTEVFYHQNTALFCGILSVGTFVLAYCLRVFRNSHFLGRSIRRAIGDFGVPISIATFVYLSYSVPQIYTEKLIVPEGISPTSPSDRSWVIPFNAVPIWVPFISAVAAMLVYVLIFMETQISELILDSRGLKKGSGFHVDIVIISLINIICGFLGMPFQSGATIRSVTHVSAVTVISDSQDGETQTLVAKEQRVSGFIISLAVGLSVIMAPILRIIPVSILYGVFFYMGIVSISGVQFLHRIRLIFTPTKYHGTDVYVEQVPTYKMHMFTCVQILALGALWLVKSSRYSLALPFILVLMIPLRIKLSSYFTPTEMAALDGNLPEVDVKDEPDFYEQSHLSA